MNRRIREKWRKAISFPRSSDRGKYSVFLPGHHPQVVRGNRRYRRIIRLAASRGWKDPRFAGYFGLTPGDRELNLELFGVPRMIDATRPEWRHVYYSPAKERARIK